MKKAYIKPCSRLMGLEEESMLCGSGDIVSDKGMSYGGVDDTGTVTPEAREIVGGRSSSAWEEW
jgi:hypothetical protein